VAVKGAASFAPNGNNMAQLHRTILDLSPGATAAVSYCPNKLYGLQYYLDGNLRRLSPTGREPWADGSLAAYAASLAAAPGAPRVMVTIDYREPDVDRVFSSMSIAYERRPGRRWTLYALPSPDGAVAAKTPKEPGS
jgi:hypothetical protein